MLPEAKESLFEQHCTQIQVALITRPMDHTRPKNIYLLIRGHMLLDILLRSNLTFPIRANGCRHYILCQNSINLISCSLCRTEEHKLLDIPMRMYGTMDGKGTLELAEKTMAEDE